MQKYTYADGVTVYKENEKVVLAVKDIPIFGEADDDPEKLEIIGYETAMVDPKEYSI